MAKGDLKRPLTWGRCLISPVAEGAHRRQKHASAFPPAEIGAAGCGQRLGGCWGRRSGKALAGPAEPTPSPPGGRWALGSTAFKVCLTFTSAIALVAIRPKETPGNQREDLSGRIYALEHLLARSATTRWRGSRASSSGVLGTRLALSLRSLPGSVPNAAAKGL